MAVKTKKNSLKKKAVRKVKKSPAKKPKKAAVVKRTKKTLTSGKPIGKVTHFYGQIKVAVVTLNSGLKKGDRVRIGKKENFFEQAVKSMQINREAIEKAKKGQEIGLKVNREVREGHLVFKV